jgi:glycosyltransferase involved in cell wall biosynthesis
LIRLSARREFVCLATVFPKIGETYVAAGMPTEKIVVHPSGHDGKAFEIAESKATLRKKLGLPLDGTIVTYAGSLKPGKAIPFLLAVAKRMRPFHFVVVGGSESEIAEHREQHLGDADAQVRFIGFVPHRDVARYLKASDVLVLFYSLRERRRVMDLATTSPIKLFEYMASGVPIVATDVPAVRHVAEDAVLMCGPDDVDDAVRAVLLATRGGNDVRTRQEEALRLARSHTYDRRCSALLQKYADACRTR